MSAWPAYRVIVSVPHGFLHERYCETQEEATQIATDLAESLRRRGLEYTPEIQTHQRGGWYQGEEE